MARLGVAFSDDPLVEKYYGQRHRLWSRFDEGVWMTQRGWCEVTPEAIARSSAELHKTLKKTTCVLDLFCGCGGDTTQLALVYDKVIAVDKDPDAIAAAKKNVEVYGVGNRVSFHCCDFRSLKPDNLEVEAVHCSPPWGGQLYAASPTFDIENSLREAIGMDFSELFRFITAFSKNITIFLPRNVLLYSVIPRGFRGNFAVYRHYLNERCKAVTLYWGDLLDCSSLKAPAAPAYSLKNKILPRPQKRVRGQ
ncbi:proliferator-activated receptor-interacting protein (PRIP) [Trypanosoma rangeli]|uniref:Trimethylguanosine synthase n=1 Tax=Trypanosoma rangeli TaxID=5698 RepID=A0A3S5IRD7_TRYRA|nr:proliferator-activated receptor-interacting protein (PRIP) [Trypanosoma rangeli]RNF06084.1 proliferator-activated receptor-interacting protein (PRIP) [Trypanosoma rangeli]|eukprot:RNF06084.1 proliferator-activated receptor-interacting protein (PRIP) [Trypanosoma rangeli]